MQPTPDTPERWSLANAGHVEARDWGGDVVVYDAAAAATHLLDVLAGGVVLALLDAGAPLSVDELARRVLGEGRAYGGADDRSAASVAADRSALSAWLADLERVGLTTRMPA